MSNQTKKHSHCLLCGSDQLRSLAEYTEAGLVQCGQCGFVFASAIPTTDELLTHYAKYSRNDAISSITISRYQEICRNLKSHQQTNNWLDVGCGNGHLLDVAQSLGWTAYGTEFTDNAVEICRSKGIRMEKGVLDITKYTAGDFDVISFIEVLEHINNPNEELTKFHYLLRKGGLLYITTPNFNSITRHFLKSKWHVIEYPEHLSYYTAQSIDRLLRTHGFRKVKLETTGISPAAFRKARHTANHEQAVFNKDEDIRNFTEQSNVGKLAKWGINGLLNLSRSGDSIKALYEKV